jgi:hypothetical protein
LTYQLRYRAHTVGGWGDFSPIAEILAATIPDATSEPETINVDTDISISWTAPLFTGGVNVEITSYRVDILLASGDYVEACLVTLILSDSDGRSFSGALFIRAG